MKTWLKNMATSIKEYPKVVKDFADLEQKYLSLLVDYDKLKKKWDFSAYRDVNDSEYWNEKWQKNNIWYKAPQKKLVTTYLNDEVNVVLPEKEIDAVPLGAMKWLDQKFGEGKFNYQVDKGEEWSEPNELLKKGVGDCDDYGILLYSVIRNTFKKLGVWENVKHRLKCVAGNVNRYSEIPSHAGGHFYLNWLHSNGKWFTIETTYYRDRAILNYGKKEQKLNPAYGVIWFTFNEYTSWSQFSLTVSKEDFEKSKEGD